MFARWITGGEHNVEFVTQTGYLPVTQDGLEKLLDDTGLVENNKYRMLSTTQ